MDFLVNFENGTLVQTPSKLIDYALCSRPILSISSNNVNCQIINQFLNYNFSQSLVIDDIEKYNIENVARQFEDLF
jgi:hypothetical protein